MKIDSHFDVIILGGGAAGLMCAIEAGKRGRKTLVLDHAKKPAEKIRISGGGRCNFTNLHSSPKNFLSQNPHFCKSALSAYGPQDFINLVKKHHIDFEEKTLGQLFCVHSAKDIIEMLLIELAQAGAELWLETTISDITKSVTGFELATSAGRLSCESLVVATGGKSIPKMGATGFGYQIATQFNLPIIEPRPALVPFTYPSTIAETWAAMAGVAMDVRASINKVAFDEAMLITHRGLSGPAILQISSYWREGQTVALDLMPREKFSDFIAQRRKDTPKAMLANALSEVLPKRFAGYLAQTLKANEIKLAELSNTMIEAISQMVHQFQYTPGGTEGYRTAEVTLGGVDTNALSQKTMEAKTVPNLYFIGEVVDVTGHLGGHNFQWAWASGFAAGQVPRDF
ncbi:MAG: NAD(P)/FAD-dependent oxidoreductase [Ahrensia sp.]|nr:NAD(P)/FAD-dependent oxidoreductase [Ahrensia sp.]